MMFLKVKLCVFPLQMSRESLPIFCPSFLQILGANEDDY